MTASLMRLPFGRFQSNGTDTLAHWNCNCLSSPAQTFQAIPFRSPEGAAESSATVASAAAPTDTATAHNAPTVHNRTARPVLGVRAAIGIPHGSENWSVTAHEAKGSGDAIGVTLNDKARGARREN